MSNQDLIANPGGDAIRQAAAQAALEAGVAFLRRFGFSFFGDPDQLVGNDQTEQMRRHAQALYDDRKRLKDENERLRVAVANLEARLAPQGAAAGGAPEGATPFDPIPDPSGPQEKET